MRVSKDSLRAQLLINAPGYPTTQELANIRASHGNLDRSVPRRYAPASLAQIGREDR